MFARAMLIIGAIILFVASTTLGAAIRQPNLQRYDAIMDGTNMPLRRSGAETPKTGAIWKGNTHQHTRDEDVGVPLPQPPAVRVEDAAVRRDPHPVSGTVKGAIWRGSSHEEAKEKARHEASIDPANKRRTLEADYRNIRRKTDKPVSGAIWKSYVHEEADKRAPQ
ncbi:hypothetical protein SCLCIDRAFT_7524 [Scleroderma citrinum Foug A]|uniref:Uncharacterized protein n=1 Tax=Scleroderma citrinum Foug A TaxID=1036808 RepID=A0A0C3A1X2_9AGAM|nr:hypothetical protein SCLCIDRAFT_7524 [Scleroderma citrinum Foug A]